MLYDGVNDNINELNESEVFENILDYLDNFRKFDFRQISEKFKLIDTNTTSIFVSLNIDRKWFSESELKFLDNFDFDFTKMVSGNYIFKIYEIIIESQQGFIEKIIDKKQIGGIMSKFMFSTFTNSKLEDQLKMYFELDIFDKFGIIYLEGWKDIYSINDGINTQIIDNDIFL